MNIEELSQLSSCEFLTTLWGESVVSVINQQHIQPMTMDEFLTHCTACGGNWGGMLLTGINKLYPEVYEVIPDDMGVFAWYCINITLSLLGVNSK